MKMINKIFNWITVLYEIDQLAGLNESWAISYEQQGTRAAPNRAHGTLHAPKCK